MKKLSVPVILFVAVLMLAQPLTAQETGMKRTVLKPESMEKLEKECTTLKPVEMEPFFYCAVEMTGNYEQHGTAFMMLYGEAGKQGLPMTEAPFGIYYNSPETTAEEDLKWEIGMPVPEDKEILAPLMKKKWEHTLVVKKGFEGVFDSEEMKAVYTDLAKWAEENGYAPAGPPMERFLGMPSTNEKGETVGKVEMVMPIQKKVKKK
jgi:effector-binding domain-containing protein